MNYEATFLGLIGGTFIGSAAGIMLLCNGRIAGISGIYGRLADRLVDGGDGDGDGAAHGDQSWRLLFIAGLIVGGLLLRFAAPSRLPIGYESAGGLAVVALGGLLVGFGARLGSGCTSGHGVCGVSRLSPRSVVATFIFMAAGMLAVRLAAPILGG